WRGDTRRTKVRRVACHTSVRHPTVSNMSTREVMDQLHAAIAALDEEDVRSLPEATLTEQIDQLVAVLHQLDAHLNRVANAVLAGGFAGSEVVVACPPGSRRGSGRPRAPSWRVAARRASVVPSRHDGVVLFAELAATSAAVAETSGRRAKVGLLAAALKALAAAGNPAEIEAGAAYLAGEMRQRQIGVGWASLRDLPPPSETPVLGVLDVDKRLTELSEVSGSGSQARRRNLVAALF